ncbi:MAG TPA: FlgD immunoglobulin-like domain containing protein [Rubricoccaceae bacterium]|nr:FlgD immunoglobulin-like domain containing protein [Rubricoccaceae bacterium]
MRDLLIVLFVLALPGGAARAQGKLTGGLLTWERVGDFPVKPTALAFDGAGALYAVHIVDVYHLDLSGGFPGVWEFRSEEADDDALLGLGPDTLIATGGHTERSTDGGWTWVEVHEDGSDSSFGLHEAAPDTPFAGNLFVGSFPPAASEDRGATWEERGQIPGFGESADVFVTLSSGRLVAGAHWGAAYSDDAGWTWQTSSLWEFGRFLCDIITRVESPDGGERVLVRGVDALLPHARVWYSDDGGETWLPEEGVPLPDADNGVGRGHAAGLWALGGARALAVLGRGVVYATEDGGETWSEVGQLPDVDENTYAHTSVLGLDGRLYVGLVRIGSQPGNSWVYRTEQRVAPPVAAEPGLEPQEGLGLEVRPNPSSGEVVVEVTLAAPSAVRLTVHDALGREVAVVHNGQLPAGARTFAFDGAALPSGVYVVQMEAKGASVSRRFTLVR